MQLVVTGGLTGVRLSSALLRAADCPLPPSPVTTPGSAGYLSCSSTVYQQVTRPGPATPHTKWRMRGRWWSVMRISECWTGECGGVSVGGQVGRRQVQAATGIYLYTAWWSHPPPTSSNHQLHNVSSPSSVWTKHKHK